MMKMMIMAINMFVLTAVLNCFEQLRFSFVRSVCMVQLYCIEFVLYFYTEPSACILLVANAFYGYIY